MFSAYALSSSSVLAQLIIGADPEERRALRDDIQEHPLPYLVVSFSYSDAFFCFGSDPKRHRWVRHLPASASSWSMEDLRAWVRKKANSILATFKN